MYAGWHLRLREGRARRGHLGNGLRLPEAGRGGRGEGRDVRTPGAAGDGRLPGDVRRAGRDVRGGACAPRTGGIVPALHGHELRAGRDGYGDGLLPRRREGRALVGHRPARARDRAARRRPRHLLGAPQPAHGAEPPPRGEQGEVPGQGGLGGGHAEAPPGLGLQPARRRLRREAQAPRPHPHGLPLGRRPALPGRERPRPLHLPERTPAVFRVPERVPPRLRRVGGLPGADAVRAEQGRPVALRLLHRQRTRLVGARRAGHGPLRRRREAPRDAQRGSPSGSSSRRAA